MANQDLRERFLGPMRRGRFELAEIVREVCDNVTQRLAEQNVLLELDVPDDLWVSVDRTMIATALRKLVDNAVEAMSGGGELTITGVLGRFGLEIEVADSGSGISGEAQARGFEPFFTTKPGQAGLGLSVVERIAQAHGGSVQVCNCPDGGAAFTLQIPMMEMRAAA